MRNKSIRKYYDLLHKKRFQLILKRLFDIIASAVLIVLLLVFFIIIAAVIRIDSNGPAIYKQIRVTKYGRKFKILKFRTMLHNPASGGHQVTVKGDSRITKAGKFLRRTRLDELPQLFNIISGDMSFVGCRPEVLKYVDAYTDEMMATLLLPAGVTSPASIQYKDEERLLSETKNVDNTYISEILPAKMKLNLSYIESFSFLGDIAVMFQTVAAVAGRSDEPEKAAEEAVKHDDKVGV